MDGTLACETERKLQRASLRIGRAEDVRFFFFEQRGRCWLVEVRFLGHEQACFEKQLMPLGYSGQFQNSIPLPVAMTNGQQSPHMQRIHGCDGHQPMPSEGAYLIQRNLDNSAGIALNGYFDTQSPECSRRGPGNDLNDLNQNSCLQLQLGVHNPYQCYDMNFLGEYKLNPDGHFYAQTQNAPSGGPPASSNMAPQLT